MTETGNVADTPVIEVAHVATRLGHTFVHDDISLTVYRGEVFAIAGGNGSGKSTLLRELVRLQEPTSGTIRIFGHDLMKLSAQESRQMRRGCGILFQHSALFSSLTVRQNIAVPLQEHTTLSPTLIDEVARLKMTLADFPLDSAEKLPSELSGGMRKRAALARALALDPELLFLDEPTSGLDPVSADAFDELVCQLKDVFNLTVVMITHDLDSLWRVADRVAVLGNKRVLGIGTMEALSHSEDPVIREYLAGPRGRAAREQAWSRR